MGRRIGENLLGKLNSFNLEHGILVWGVGAPEPRGGGLW